MTPNVEVISDPPAAYAAEIQMIPLSEMHESQWNPRKYFAEGPMVELTDSVRRGGIRTPLIARPRLQGGYETGAGHRRMRAAKRAGLTHVPVIVREMSDTEFLELVSFENSQREDPHPLEEAAGFQAYIDGALADKAEVAAKIGKSGSYVYQRLQLLKLTPDSQKAYLDGKFSAGHAVEIARLDAEDQVKAITACEPPEWNPAQGPLSVRALKDWIRRNLQLDLDDAIFDAESADLVPAAGSCAACPHRLENALDFNPIEDRGETCTRPACFEQKTAAHIEVEKVRLVAQHGAALVLLSHNGKTALPGVVCKPDWHEAHSGGSPGFIVEGYHAGREVRVIVQGRIPAAAPTPKPAASPSPAKPKPSKEERDRDAERLKREKEEKERERTRLAEEREQREKKLETEKALRFAVLRAVLAKVKWPPRREEIAALLGDVVPELDGELDEVVKEQGVEPGNRFVEMHKLSEDRIARLAVIAHVGREFEEYAFGHGAEQLNAAAKRYGVDVAKMRAEAEGGTRKEVIKRLHTVTATKKAPAKKAAKPASKKATPKGGKKK